MRHDSWTTGYANTACGSAELKTTWPMRSHKTWTDPTTKSPKFFFTRVPSQVPNSFKIVPLPNKIVSWATLLLRRLPMQPQYSKEHTKTTLGCGNNGKNTANPQASKKISSLSNSQSNTEDTFSMVFAVAMHEGRFSRPCDAPLASGTISGAISHVAVTFRSHGYPNPSNDKHGALD